MTARNSRPSNPEPTAEELRAFALNLLARREYGERELAGRLARRWAAPPAGSSLIAECVARLAAEGLLSDRRFADVFVRTRRRRGQGPLRIRAELEQRGVDSSAIAHSLEDGDEVWTARALEWLGRHGPRDMDRKQRVRFYRRLVNRGFSHSQAMAALDEYARLRAAGEAPGS